MNATAETAEITPQERLARADAIFAHAFQEALSEHNGNPVAACEGLLQRAVDNVEFGQVVIYIHIQSFLDAIGRRLVTPQPVARH